jgi:hypothetical protein
MEVKCDGAFANLHAHDAGIEMQAEWLSKFTGILWKVKL